MDLSLIRGALEECRQVVLPGYGAFLRSDSDAHGALQLTFTPFILRSDGAFESYISSSQGVDSVSASQIVHKLAGYVRQQIDSTGYCNIAGLGSLRREANGMVLFNPETVQVTAESDSGRVSLSSEGACGSSVVGAEDLCESDRPIANREPREGVENIAPHPSEDERYANCAIPPVVAEPFSHAHYGRKRWRWMVWAMLGVGVCAYAVWHFGLVGSISSLWDSYWHFSEIAKFDNPLDGGGGAALGTAKPIEPSLTPSTEDTSLKRAYDAMDGQAAPSSVSERLIPARGKLPSADPDLPYHIVWGSFSTRDKAEGHARQMLKEGFQAQVLPSEDGVMRVVLSSFSTKEHALQSLAAVRQRYAKAWLHSQ